ncbi:MAG TPA: nuclear transport factor 2 family protein [Steroidobacteraceae bacterium]|nr:nuclear transport factor 2 family protein [Steroidobacteraceae bacterium]
MKTSTHLLLCVFGVLSLAAAAAHGAPLPPDLAKAVADYDAAQIKGDGGELKRLLAEDYTLINSSGTIENKAQLIADYTAPGYKLDPFAVREPIEKVWADGAVMGGIATLSGTDGGKRFEVTLRFADIWAKRHGAWQVIYTHVSKPR